MIRIWKDQWLPTQTTFKVQSSIRNLSPIACVELLNTEGTKWITSLVMKTFWKEEVEVILSIPISQREGGDKFIWGHDKKETFIVNSAYHVKM